MYPNERPHYQAKNWTYFEYKRGSLLFVHFVSFLGWFMTVYLESFKSPFFSLYIKLWYIHFLIFRRLKVQAWACCGRTKLKLLIKFKLEVFLSWRDVTLWFTDDFLFDFKANKVSIKWNKFYLDLTIIKKKPIEMIPTGSIKLIAE